MAKNLLYVTFFTQAKKLNAQNETELFKKRIFLGPVNIG